MMYYYDNYFPFHMFGFGFIFMILFWGVVIYLAVLLFKNNFSVSKNRALDILKERYAKGEITKEQFETMKQEVK